MLLLTLRLHIHVPALSFVSKGVLVRGRALYQLHGTRFEQVRHTGDVHCDVPPSSHCHIHITLSPRVIEEGGGVLGETGPHYLRLELPSLSRVDQFLRVVDFHSRLLVECIVTLTLDEKNIE